MAPSILNLNHMHPTKTRKLKARKRLSLGYAHFNLFQTLGFRLFSPMAPPSLDNGHPGLMSMDSQDRRENFESTAAVKLQKVYRSYRTRRRLADSAVVAEELWWQAIDYARLNHSTVSFFNFHKAETAASRWSRISLIASKVGKGLCKDTKAQKLAFQHWIEAIDPRHRYGRNLNFYYEEWRKGDARQPFFYWLDIGGGKEVDLRVCPRSRLRQECIIYLGPQEREYYEYIISEGMMVHKHTGNLLHTNQGLQGSKWIFVMSTSRKLYGGEKKKGLFHHSSFLAGGATLAAGRLEAEHGKLKDQEKLPSADNRTPVCKKFFQLYFDESVSAYSGHCRPTDENLGSFLAFLKENGMSLDEVQVLSPVDDHESYDIGTSVQEGSELERRNSYKRTLSSNLQSSKRSVPKKEILQRIKSKKEACSYQLGHQLSLKWSTGAGPRIGCVADYPLELRLQSLKFVNLSSGDPHTASASTLPSNLTSITSFCVVM